MPDPFIPSTDQYTDTDRAMVSLQPTTDPSIFHVGTDLTFIHIPPEGGFLWPEAGVVTQEWSPLTPGSP